MKHVDDNDLRVVTVGKASKSTRHSEEFILQIKFLLDQGYNACRIAKMLGVYEKLVYRVKDGTSWSHLTGVPYRGKNKRRLKNNDLNAISLVKKSRRKYVKKHERKE